MIKILFTSDWHLGNCFHGYDRHEEHRDFLRWLLQMVVETEPDALLVSGDIFDNANPSAASQELYYSFLDELSTRFPKLQTILIAGNHDSAARLEAPRPMLERHRVYVRGVVHRLFDGGIDYQDLIVPIHANDGSDEQIRVLTVPYLREGDFPRGSTYGEGVNHFFSELLAVAEATGSQQEGAEQPESFVLMAHLYATGSEIAENSSERVVIGGSEMVNLDQLDERIACVLLGHLHRQQKLGGRFERMYAGSALPMSFTERNYSHGALLYELEGGKVKQAPQRLVYPLQHELVSLPDKPLPLEQVLNLLKELPERKDSSQISSDTAPYLEVKVLLEQPMAGIYKVIEDALAEKEVRLCRTVISYPVAEQEEAAEEAVESVEDLLNRNPIEVIKKSYFNKHHVEMRKELVSLAEQAIEMARTEGGEE